jgi:hypothetical protein
VGILGPGRDVPTDEYEVVAPPIAHLLRTGRPDEEVAAHLANIRRQLGVELDPEHDLQVARKLREWYRWSFERTR